MKTEFTLTAACALVAFAIVYTYVLPIINKLADVLAFLGR
jgi:hypothetical protein